MRPNASRYASATGAVNPEFDEIGVAAHGVQWRAQLMSHDGEELTLDPICRLGIAAGCSLSGL